MMYRENDFSMRPDTVTDEFIRQLLENESNGGCHGKPDGCGASELSPSCGCNEDERKQWGLHGYPLAMVYSPVQEWKSLYDNELGLSRGTIFKELELPFKGSWNDEGGSCKIGCGGQRNG